MLCYELPEFFFIDRLPNISYAHKRHKPLEKSNSKLPESLTQSLNNNKDPDSICAIIKFVFVAIMYSAKFNISKPFIQVYLYRDRNF